MKKARFLIFFLLFLGFGVILFGQDAPSEPSTSLNIWTIVSGILAVLGTIFTTAFVKIKKKIGQVVTLARKTVDLLETISNAISDNAVDSDEILAIKQDIQDVKTAWKDLWGKTV